MDVEQISLSRQGPALSRLAVGMMNLSQWSWSTATLVDWLERVLELGLTAFDHADIYGSYTCEARFGEALRASPGLRDRMQLVSKCGIRLLSPNRPEHRVKSYDTSQRHIVWSAENSLRQLATDHLDLFLIHRPDPLLDPDEVAAAFTSLRTAGKVAHFGVSNFTPAQFDVLASRLPFPLVTNQIELSLLAPGVMEDGTLDHCLRHRISPMIWSPYAGGRLFLPEDERAGRVRAALQEVGAELGGSALDQVALAWILKHPSRPVPILGTARLDRLAGAVGALNLNLTREQWFRIWEASAGHEVP